MTSPRVEGCSTPERQRQRKRCNMCKSEQRNICKYKPGNGCLLVMVDRTGGALEVEVALLTEALENDPSIQSASSSL